MTNTSNNIAKTDRVLLVVLAVSLMLNVIQYWLPFHTSRKPALSAVHVSEHLLPLAGARFSGLRLISADGEAERLTFKSGQQPTIVYVMSPTCTWCEKNKPNVDALASQLSRQYRIIGVSSTRVGLTDYIKQNKPSFPLYTLDPAATEPPISTSVTPRTLLFSSDGTYLTGWDGAYLGDLGNQVASYFKIRLPSQ